MLSTDLEVELEINIQGANIITPGETTIPAKKAADIIRELPEGQVSFELNEESSKLTVKSSSGRYNLATIPGSDFPDFDVIKSDTTHTITTEKLLELFHKTSFAMANQDCCDGQSVDSATLLAPQRLLPRLSQPLQLLQTHQ